MMPSTTLRRIVRAALVGVAALTAVLLTATAWTQPPSPSANTSTPERAARGAGDAHDGRNTDHNRVELEVAEALVEAKRTLLRIDEARAEQATQWSAYYAKMVRDGKVTEDRAIAARDDLVVMQEHVAAERAELKVAELRLRNARHATRQGDQSPGGGSAQAGEDAEALEALVEAKRALLRAGELRAKQAKQTEARYERLFREGMATEDQVLAAKDDILMMDAALAWGRAELKMAELWVKSAQRPATQDTASGGLRRRLVALEQRLLSAEMKADLLQHEVGRLRRELPRETHGTR